MIRRRLLLLIALTPLVPLACSGDDTGDAGTDAGADAASDGTTTDATTDSGADVTTTDAASDAKADVVVADAGSDGASDADVDASDAATDADASLDAGADADASLDAGDDADASLDAGDDADASLDAGDDADGGGQWQAPTCDGVVSAQEYGGALYTTASGSQNWYMTWDATNLYVGLDTATLTEAAVIYVGYSGLGPMATYTYDVTGGTLPFAADAVVYAKSGYQELRLGSQDAGTWGSAVTNAVTFCSNGTTREEVIPWTALGSNGLPASLRFLAYATSGSGYVYGQIPTSNPSGNIGTSATFTNDFYVADTGTGTPFATTE